jgi:hypothetical protein
MHKKGFQLQYPPPRIINNNPSLGFNQNPSRNLEAYSKGYFNDVGKTLFIKRETKFCYLTFFLKYLTSIQTAIKLPSFHQLLVLQCVASV